MFRSLCKRVLDEGGDLVARIRIDQRTDIDPSSNPLPTLSAAMRALSLLVKSSTFVLCT